MSKLPNIKPRYRKIRVKQFDAWKFEWVLKTPAMRHFLVMKRAHESYESRIQNATCIDWPLRLEPVCSSSAAHNFPLLSVIMKCSPIWISKKCQQPVCLLGPQSLRSLLSAIRHMQQRSFSVQSLLSAGKCASVARRRALGWAERRLREPTSVHWELPSWAGALRNPKTCITFEIWKF